MITVQTIEDVYPALDELVAELKATGELRLAAILYHRLHQVAWTARSELFEDLQNVLIQALTSDGTRLSRSSKQQIKCVLYVIEGFLDASKQ